MAQISSGPLNSPYRRAFERLPSSLQSSLWDQGYSRVQPDGELLKESLELEQGEQQVTSMWSTSLGMAIVDKGIEYDDLTKELEALSTTSSSAQVRTTIVELLSHLVAMVPCGKQTESYSLFEMQLTQQDRMACSKQFAPLSELSNITKRWRH